MSSEEAAAAVVPGVHLNGVVVRGEARARALQGRRLGASVLSRTTTWARLGDARLKRLDRMADEVA